jgi:hypothetical protein
VWSDRDVNLRRISYIYGYVEHIYYYRYGNGQSAFTSDDGFVNDTIDDNQAEEYGAPLMLLVL